MNILHVLTVGLVVLEGAQITQVRAQSEGLAAMITQARQANATLMKQYSWQSRTELIDNGNVADTCIEAVSYGPDGTLQRTLLNDESSRLPHGFLRRRIAEKKRERVEKYLVGLRHLLDQYTLPTQGKVLDFVSAAQIQAPDANGLLQITGSSVVAPGDTITLTVKAMTRQPTNVAITTSFEGDAVTASGSFKTLASGLNHLEFGEVDVPASCTTSITTKTTDESEPV
jgi:hypothetical protein